MWDKLYEFKEGLFVNDSGFTFPLWHSILMIDTLFKILYL